MGTCYLIVGNFGVGKTSIVNYFPHTKIEGSPFTEVEGFLSLGGKEGADPLSKMGYDKRRVFTQILPAYNNRDIIIHSVFYQSIQDVNRYLRTHKVEVFYLDTPFEVNTYRIWKRSGGKKSINEKTYVSFLKGIEKIRQFSIYKKIPFHKIDNSRPLQDVAGEIWKIMTDNRG